MMDVQEKESMRRRTYRVHREDCELPACPDCRWCECSTQKQGPDHVCRMEDDRGHSSSALIVAARGHCTLITVD